MTQRLQTHEKYAWMPPVVAVSIPRQHWTARHCLAVRVRDSTHGASGGLESMISAAARCSREDARLRGDCTAPGTSSGITFSGELGAGRPRCRWLRDRSICPLLPSWPGTRPPSTSAPAPGNWWKWPLQREVIAHHVGMRAAGEVRIAQPMRTPISVPLRSTTRRLVAEAEDHRHQTGRRYFRVPAEVLAGRQRRGLERRAALGIDRGEHRRVDHRECDAPSWPRRPSPHVGRAEQLLGEGTRQGGCSRRLGVARQAVSACSATPSQVRRCWYGIGALL